jgi:hypothetical protein
MPPFTRDMTMTLMISGSADLFWQAFRYASNEMTPAERSEFDSLLATNQGAREAVARVVELEGLVLTAESLPAKARGLVRPSGGSYGAPNYWVQPVGWISLGAAACLAVVMAFQAWSPGGNAAVQVPGMSPSPQVAASSPNSDGSKARGGDRVAGGADGELALAWAQAHAQLRAGGESAVAGANRDTAIQEAANQDTANQDTVNQEAVNQEAVNQDRFGPDRFDHELSQIDDWQPTAAPAWLLAAVAETEAADVEN